jgi:hypothetical protein
MELLEDLPEPTSFSHAVGHGAILSLGTRSGDDVLALGGPGDEVVTEEHNIARGGPACFRTTRLVCIRVDRQLRGGGRALQVEAEVQGASQIAQDALHRGEVRLSGIVHTKANLLYGVGDVGVGEHHILEGPGEARELSWISNRRPESGGVLGLCVHMHQDQLVVHHASMLKDIESKLMLSEEKSICLMMYGHCQKVVKRVKVHYGEFSLKCRYGVLQERCARCSEYNVINIKQQVYHIDAAMEDLQGGVGLGLNKSKSEVVHSEPAVPSRGHLLQPVERLVEAADPVRLHGISKPPRLATVDYLHESTMQEHILLIKLVDGPET